MYNGNLMASRAIKLPTFCGRGLFNGEYGKHAHRPSHLTRTPSPEFPRSSSQS